MRRFYISLCILLFFSIHVFYSAKSVAQCKPSILIDGNIATVDQTNSAGLQLPIWLKTSQTLAIGPSTFSISVIEFSVTGTDLVFSQVLSVTTVQSVPTGKVWKVESVVKQLNPSSYTNSVFTNAGTSSWKVPACASYICVEMWGGGGGGGSGNNGSNGQNGGGGGGGSYAQGCFNVTPSSTLTITVGAGGGGGVCTGTGSTGGASSVGSLISAGGGSGGGQGSSSGGTAGTGGTSIATNNVPGFDGKAGGTQNCPATGSGAGGAAGNNGGAGGTGGSCSNGTAGTAPGGGGSGGNMNGSCYSGGTGAAGKIIITW